MWSRCQSHRVFSNCIVFHWQQGKMLAENKSWETAAGDWVWFVGTVHMDTHMHTVYLVARVTDTYTCTAGTYICGSVTACRYCMYTNTVQYNIQMYEYIPSANVSSKHLLCTLTTCWSFGHIDQCESLTSVPKYSMGYDKNTHTCNLHTHKSWVHNASDLNLYTHAGNLQIYSYPFNRDTHCHAYIKKNTYTHSAYKM